MLVYSSGRRADKSEIGTTTMLIPQENLTDGQVLALFEADAKRRLSELAEEPLTAFTLTIVNEWKYCGFDLVKSARA